MISLSSTRVIALIFVLWASLQQPAPAPPPPPLTSPSWGYVISREVDLVLLPVTVRNRDGQFVSGLKASNFQVFENGQPQTITHFQNEDVPVSVGLVVDHSGSIVARSKEVIEGLLAFVDASNPQDEEFVVNFADRTTFGLPASAPFTSNASELNAALSTPSASGRTALYDAVVAALQHLGFVPREQEGPHTN